MRGRLVLAKLGVCAGLSTAFAQFPPPQGLPPASPLPPAQSMPPSRPFTPPIQIPKLPPPKQPASTLTPPPGSEVIPAGGSVPANQAGSLLEPRPLPPAMVPSRPVNPQAVPQPSPLGPTAPALPDGSTLPPLQTEVPLPYPEQKQPLDVNAVTLKRINGSWQVWAGLRVLRDLGNDENAAKDVVRALRDLRPTEWATIGSPRPVVEYGLINGRPPVGGFHKMVVPIDLATVRVDAVKGVWCLRDTDTIHFNFGIHRADADQALAVIRKYGFNRVGTAGPPTAPAMTYFFASLETEKTARPPGGAMLATVQENALTRTGIPVPGVGYVGEMVKIDPRKVEVRRENAEWVVAFGVEVLGRFGAGETTARDAARVIQDGRYTEFCRLGGASGMTFFLANGKAPTRVPFAAQGRPFSLSDLKVQPINGRWAVTESGRHLFDVTGPEEGEQLVRVLRHYGFDQVCQVGASPRASLRFLARTR